MKFLYLFISVLIISNIILVLQKNSHADLAKFWEEQYDDSEKSFKEYRIHVMEREYKNNLLKILP